ncbi:hypothetical protein Tco_1571054 [Tanacetum coccineum]
MTMLKSTESCSENIDIKPMDSVVCISNDTTHDESDKYLKTNHDAKSKLSETNMALPPRDQRHPFIRFEGLEYTDADIGDFEERLGFGEAVLDLDTIRALQFQLGGAKRRMSWREFILAMGLHTTKEIESTGFGTYWVDSARQIPDKGDLSAYWRGISSEGDFLGTAPSYTAIRDLMLRLCHRLIACSIAGRSQAPEKVTVTDLFYLRSMDVDSINIPYLLARYLRRFASGRKRGAMISEGQFVARLAENFRLLTEERLQGLTVAEGSTDVDEGAQAVPAFEEVHGIRESLAEQREVIDAMARDFSRFTVWATSGISQLLDASGATYTSITSIKCVLTQEHLDAICSKYFVPEEVHPQLLSSDATMHERPTGKVRMYTRFFDYANYRIPFSTFFVFVLTHFRIPFSQLSVFGSAKVSHFEIMCRVCNINPSVGLFRYFYTHNYKNGWFGFTKRPNVRACYSKNLDSVKNWNDHFFWVDEFVVPANARFGWFSGTNIVKDRAPTISEYNVEHANTLIAQASPFLRFPEEFLCWVGISRNYLLNKDTYPRFEYENGEGGCYFPYIR